MKSNITKTLDAPTHPGATLDIVSVGYAAQLLQRPLSQIIEAADALQVPAHRINGIRYYTGGAVEAIRQALDRRDGTDQTL